MKINKSILISKTLWVNVAMCIYAQLVKDGALEMTDEEFSWMMLIVNAIMRKITKTPVRLL